jgi:pimeloyl-ACP methyl ester carboxylesterase
LNNLILSITLLIIVIISPPLHSKVLGDSPASIVELTITSNGDRMSGLAYLAADNEPHPTILLLHGYPGNEKNLDVAQAMRNKGWNVVFFHYRGAWGSEGEFSIVNAEQDVQNVLQYMNDENNAQKLRIDTEKISIVGHSMGGHMAVAGLIDNPNIKCAVSYDGANMGANGFGIFDNPKTSKMWKEYSDSLFMLKGWSGDKAIEEVKQYGSALDLLQRLNKVNARPILFIAANTDVIPMEVHITPLVNALKTLKNNKVILQVIEDDHSFSSSRLLLIESTADFLDTNCKNDY